MPYSDKYTSRGSSFSNKYSGRSTVFSDKYSRRTGYLQKEDSSYLLLEGGGRIVISSSPFNDKYSLRNT